MPKHSYKTNFIIILTIALLSSCGSAGFNSYKKLDKLYPGMTYNQVAKILGKPKTVKQKQNVKIARWKLHQKWVGIVPYDMYFNAQNNKLVSWHKNERDFQKSQQKLALLAKSIEKAGNKGNASVNGPNDANLQRRFAVKLYRFSAVGGGQTGGSETTINLCPNGTYNESGESGYSGGGWGTASQNGEQGH